MLKFVLILIVFISFNESTQADDGWKVIDDSFDEFADVFSVVKWTVRIIPSYTKYLGIYTVSSFNMPLSAKLKHESSITKYQFYLNMGIKLNDNSMQVRN